MSSRRTRLAWRWRRLRGIGYGRAGAAAVLALDELEALLWGAG